MHTYESLSAATANAENDEPGTEVAESVPFLHMCPPNRLPQVLSQQTLRVPEPSLRRPKTIESEEMLGINPSVYFYVGRTHPTPVGTAACSLPCESALLQSNSEVSPFDSGGLAQNKLELNWEDYASTKAEYLNMHSCAASDHVRYFDPFLSQYFSGPDDYWENSQSRNRRRNVSENEKWRNWTFELRVEESANVEDASWFFDSETDHRYQEWILEGKLPELPVDRYSVVENPVEAAELTARSNANA